MDAKNDAVSDDAGHVRHMRALHPAQAAGGGGLRERGMAHESRHALAERSQAPAAMAERGEVLQRLEGKDLESVAESIDVARRALISAAVACSMAEQSDRAHRLERLSRACGELIPQEWLDEQDRQRLARARRL